MKQNKLLIGFLLGLAVLIVIAAVPITNLLLESDMNAGGHSITNVVAVLGTNGLPITGSGGGTGISTNGGTGINNTFTNATVENLLVSNAAAIWGLGEALNGTLAWTNSITGQIVTIQTNGVFSASGGFNTTFGTNTAAHIAGGQTNEIASLATNIAAAQVNAWGATGTVQAASSIVAVPAINSFLTPYPSISALNPGILMIMPTNVPANNPIVAFGLPNGQTTTYPDLSSQWASSVFGMQGWNGYAGENNDWIWNDLSSVSIGAYYDPRAAVSFARPINRYMAWPGGSAASLSEHHTPAIDSVVSLVTPVRFATDSGSIPTGITNGTAVDLWTNAIIGSVMSSGVFSSLTNAGVPVYFELQDQTKKYSGARDSNHRLVLAGSWDSNFIPWAHSLGWKVGLQMYYATQLSPTNTIIGGSSFTSDTNLTPVMALGTFRRDISDIIFNGFDEILAADVAPPNYTETYNMWGDLLQWQLQEPTVTNFPSFVHESYSSFTTNPPAMLGMLVGNLTNITPYSSDEMDFQDIDNYPGPGQLDTQTNYMTFFRQLYQYQVPYQTPGHWLCTYQILDPNTNYLTTGTIRTIIAGSVLSHETIFAAWFTNQTIGIYNATLTNTLINPYIQSFMRDNGMKIQKGWDYGAGSNSMWYRSLPNGAVAVWIDNENASSYAATVTWGQIGLNTNTPLAYSVQRAYGTLGVPGTLLSSALSGSFNDTVVAGSSQIYILTPTYPASVVSADGGLTSITVNTNILGGTAMVVSNGSGNYYSYWLNRTTAGGGITQGVDFEDRAASTVQPLDSAEILLNNQEGSGGYRFWDGTATAGSQAPFYANQGTVFKSNTLTFAQVTALITNGDTWLGEMSNGLMYVTMSNNVVQAGFVGTSGGGIVP